MARWWVGITQDWFDANNWSAVSGGAGGAGVPTSADDVFIDGNGFVLVWPTAPIECNNLSLLATMTEMLLIDADAIIHGDYSQAGGYCGPTGGPDHLIEFKGNWLKTAGTFAAGTGPGVDPTCEFSGAGKTYQLNDVAAATFQNFLVSGSIIFSGTRLSVAWIAQALRITGTATIATGNRIDLNGSFVSNTGTLDGLGRLLFNYKSTNTIPTGGVINCQFFRLVLQDATTELNPREWGGTCEVEIEYTLDAQTFRLDGSTRHYFMHDVTIHCDDSAVHTAVWDCSTENAEIWVHGEFDIYKDAFPNCTFTMKWGDGVQVFRHSVNLYFSFASATSHLVVDPGKGTIFLYPRGLRVIVLPP